MNDAGVKILAAVLGFWLIMRAVNKDATGRTLIDHILGQSGGANQTLTAAPPASAANPLGTPNAQGQVDPIPGATANRLDQGFDVTGKQFLAPYAGTVVAADVRNPGWKGGGYVAVQSAANPKLVTYFAEGIMPLVQKGEQVVAGQAIGRPALNPYNFTTGNIEIGPANPVNPEQPLAQAVSNPAAAVTSFYQWLRGLGAPQATATAGAGHP